MGSLSCAYLSPRKQNWSAYWCLCFMIRLHWVTPKFGSRIIPPCVASASAWRMAQTNAMLTPWPHVSKYENGERRLDFAEFIELAEILRIDAAAFIDEYRATLAPAKGHKARRRR